MIWSDLEELLPTVEELSTRVAFDSNPNKPIARPREMQLLTAFTKKLQFKEPGELVAIETGSHTGSFAQAFRLVCRTVISIDNYSHPNPRASGPGIFLRSREIWNSIHWLWGDGAESLKAVVENLVRPRAFIFFHDSDHSYGHVMKELRLARDLGAVGIACHDIEDWEKELKTGTAFLDFVKESGWVQYSEGNLGLAVPK